MLPEEQPGLQELLSRGAQELWKLEHHVRQRGQLQALAAEHTNLSVFPTEERKNPHLS